MWNELEDIAAIASSAFCRYKNLAPREAMNKLRFWVVLLFLTCAPFSTRADTVDQSFTGPITEGASINECCAFIGQTGIVTKTTGQRALKELLEAGLIQRIGKGCKGNPLRYFLENVPGAGTARDPEVSVRSRMRMDFTHKTLMAQSFGSARQKMRIRN